MSVSAQSLHAEETRQSPSEEGVTQSVAWEIKGENELSEEATPSWTEGNQDGATALSPCWLHRKDVKKPGVFMLFLM